jgi:hypothetical protein
VSTITAHNYLREDVDGNNVTALSLWPKKWAQNVMFHTAVRSCADIDLDMALLSQVTMNFLSLSRQILRCYLQL